MISGNKEAFKLFQNIDSTLYLGLDCSSRAIHAVWIDEDERVIAMLKWRSGDSEFESRFLEICLQFSKD